MKHFYLRKILDFDTIKLSSVMFAPDIQCSRNTDSEFITIFLKSHLNLKCGDETFRININNQWRVKNFLTSILAWFFDEGKKDLFVYDKNNELVFNSEYKSLVKTVYSGTDTNSWMRIYPMVVRDKGTPTEGVMIFINSQSAFTELSLSKFGALTDVICNFDFDRESLLFSQLLKLSSKVNKSEGCDLVLSNSINNEGISDQLATGKYRSPFIGGK